ncbi:uncharacterized protein [Dermacentor albipictus]|uniref:uncharacterized protein n=1 Tax=Dermacentor albipictus TaxID=60249 RepID=UPI0038FC756A
MPPLGKMSEFDPKTQNFESYLERFEHFLTANDIADAKRLPVFLTVIGPEAYEVLRSLVVPAAPGEKSYAEVKRLLKEHYSPRSSVIAERCKFNRRVQQEGESVEGFIVELKHLVRKCDYGDFLQDALRDRLVAGIRNEETQRALFAERELTFDGACKIALDRELAARDTEQLRSRERQAPVLVVKSRPHQHKRPANPKHVEARKNEKCARCGRGHSSEESVTDVRRSRGAVCAAWFVVVSIDSWEPLDFRSLERGVFRVGLASKRRALGATNPEVDGPSFRDGAAALATVAWGAEDTAVATLFVGRPDAPVYCGAAPLRAAPAYPAPAHLEQPP